MRRRARFGSGAGRRARANVGARAFASVVDDDHLALLGRACLRRRRSARFVTAVLHPFARSRRIARMWRRRSLPLPPPSISAPRVPSDRLADHLQRMRSIAVAYRLLDDGMFEALVPGYPSCRATEVTAEGALRAVRHQLLRMTRWPAAEAPGASVADRERQDSRYAGYQWTSIVIIL